MINVGIAVTMIIMWGAVYCSYGRSAENGIYFLGITLPKMYRDNLQVVEIKKRYNRKMSITLWISFAFIFLSFGISFISVLIVYIMVWFFVMIGICERNLKKAGWDVYNWKKEQEWYNPAKPFKRVDTRVSANKGKMSFPAYYAVGPVVLIITTIVFAIKNGTGVAPVMNVLCSIIFLFIYNRIAHSPNKVYCDDSQINLAINSNIKYEWTRCLMLTSFGAAIAAALLQIRLPEVIASAQIMYSVMISLLVAIIPVGFLLHAYASTLQVKESLAPQKLYDDDDIFYLMGERNPNQPGMTEKRAGIGFTFNGGKKLDLVIISLTMIFVCVIAIFLLKFDLADITYNIEERDNKSCVVLEAARYTSYFAVDDITKVELLDQRPKMSKSNGYDGANVFLGVFDVNGYGASEVYVSLGTKQVIAVTTDKKCYLFNDEDSDETLRIYNELVELMR